MGLCPEGLTLDRIDNRLGHSKENCRWANMSDQSSNRRKSIRNTSGRIGVHYEKSKNVWVAELVVQKIYVFKKRFKTYDEACLAISEQELKHLGYTREEY